MSLQGVLLHASSKTQAVVARSSGEAELYGLNSAVSEGLGVQALLEDLDLPGIAVLARTDSTAATGTANRQGLGKQRHIQVQFLWIQEAIRTRTVVLRHIAGAQNPADLLTKSLPGTRHLELSQMIGLTVPDSSSF